METAGGWVGEWVGHLPIVLHRHHFCLQVGRHSCQLCGDVTAEGVWGWRTCTSDSVSVVGPRSTVV